MPDHFETISFWFFQRLTKCCYSTFPCINLFTCIHVCHITLPVSKKHNLNGLFIYVYIYNQSVDSRQLALWELISTAQIKWRSWRTKVHKLLLKLWELLYIIAARAAICCICYICCYMLLYIYVYNHENNVLSRLLSRRLCGNSYTWAHDVRLHITGTNGTKNAQQTQQEA